MYPPSLSSIAVADRRPQPGPDLDQGAGPLPSKRPPSFRPDIQGLRAVAVGLVVLYHAGLPWLPGGFVGVDVFFVISGFLITQGLVRELERRGTISLAGFYARRVRRILPAATMALLGITVATVTLLPQTRWLQIGRDVVNGSVYVINWAFAQRSVQYSARDQAASPLQHFWSLAVEEQFYVVWPLAILALVAIVALLGRVRGRSGAASTRLSRRHLVLPLALVAVPSLIWSVQASLHTPGPAYFITTTRMWELALGAALAVACPPIPRRVIVSRLLGWVGLVLIFASAVLYGSTTVFPGYAALMPTLGAAIVLWSGLPGDDERQNPLLRLRPMTWIGGLSYSLYLWHWPALLIATSMAGHLRLRYALAVAALSLVPAWMSRRFVETPIMESRRLRADRARTLQLGVILTLVSVVAGLVLQLTVLSQLDEPGSAPAASGGQAGGIAVDPATNPGAGALLDDPRKGAPVDSFRSIVPSPLAAAADAPTLDGHGCHIDIASTAATPCSFGKLDSSVTLALVGDSHAEALVPGIEAAALAHGWRLDVYTRGSCPFIAATVDLDGRPNDACNQRNANFTAAMLKHPPAAVLAATSRYQVYRAGGTPTLEASKPAMAQGFRDAWKPLLAAGIPVVTFRDMPRPDVLVADCVAQNTTHLSTCSYDRSRILWSNPPEVTAAAGLPGVHVVDLTDYVCPTARCAAVVGGVLVYRDGNHLTATYARTLGPVISKQLATALGG